MKAGVRAILRVTEALERLLLIATAWLMISKGLNSGNLPTRQIKKVWNQIH